MKKLKLHWQFWQKIYRTSELTKEIISSGWTGENEIYLAECIENEKNEGEDGEEEGAHDHKDDEQY